MDEFGATLKSIREGKGLNQDELAKKLKISRATLSDYERGKTEPNFSTLVSIAKFFHISVDNLLGNLNQKGDDSQKQQKGNVKGNLLGNLTVQKGSKRGVAEPESSYTRMPQIITVDSEGRDNVVFVPIRARAGYLAGFQDPEYIQSLPTYRLPGLSHGTFRMFEVQGHSMVPSFHESDIIIARYVENLLEIRDDRVYVVITQQDGILVKRVVNRVQRDGKLILNSDNQRHAGEYPPIVIGPEEILEVWYAVVYMSRQMRAPGELYNRLIDVETRLTLLEDNTKKPIK